MCLHLWRKAVETENIPHAHKNCHFSTLWKEYPNVQGPEGGVVVWWRVHIYLNHRMGDSLTSYSPLKSNKTLKESNMAWFQLHVIISFILLLIAWNQIVIRELSMKTTFRKYSHNQCTFWVNLWEQIHPSSNCARVIFYSQTATFYM